MNFLGHILLASAESAAPPFLWGSILPDPRWLSAAKELQRDPMVAAGVQSHHSADQAFHSQQEFVRLERELRDRLAARGLGRGSRRAAGHIGVEMLLDGEWARHAPHAKVQQATFESLAQHLHSAGFRYDATAIYRISAAGLPERYADTNFCAGALSRMFAPRPRLAFRPGDLGEVAAALAEIQPAVAKNAHAIWEATRAAYRPINP